MKLHDVRVHPETDRLAREDQLAWKIAAVAADPVAVQPEVAEMIVNRVIDNASVAIASINRHPIVSARDQALAHRREGGATLFGCAADVRVHAEWAAWANGTAVRELDYHDTFLAAEYSHPGDNIPPILAVAQQTGRDGAALVRALATGYEIQVDLVKSICLHAHKIDHVAHLGPSAAAGIGTLLGLPTEVVYQAVQQALHVTTATRQSRKGEISSWKAFAPSHAGKLAIESVDRAMRGEGAPSPIYEGEDSVIAWMLDGKSAHYQVPLPEPGEPKRAILDTYTKEHSAEYQSQALIDLAFRMGRRVGDWDDVADIVIETSHHTHYVIGTGANDPQKVDPEASRETLDHSIMYIVAVALQDGAWHHVRSYAPERGAAAGHGGAVAQDTHGGGSALDGAVPLGGSRGESVRRARGDHDEGRHADRRRDGGGERAHAGGDALGAGGLHPQVPHVDGRIAGYGGDSAVSGAGAASAGSAGGGVGGVERGDTGGGVVGGGEGDFLRLAWAKEVDHEGERYAKKDAGRRTGVPECRVNGEVGSLISSCPSCLRGQSALPKPAKRLACAEHVDTLRSARDE